MDLHSRRCSVQQLRVMLQVCGDKASETAHFVGLVDKFFDTINVHNYTHGHKTLKTFQMPFASASDFRLKVN